MGGADARSFPAVNSAGVAANRILSLLTSHLKSTQSSSAAPAGNAELPRRSARSIETARLRVDCMAPRLTPGYVEIGQRTLKCLGRKRDGLRQRRMRMNGQSDIGRVGAHFNGERHFGDQVAGVGADGACADDSMGLLVKQQLGEAFVAVERERAAAGGPGQEGLATAGVVSLGLVFGSSQPVVLG